MTEPSTRLTSRRRARIGEAIALIEDIKHSPGLYPEYDARLLALLSVLNDRLESCIHSNLTNISFDHVRGVLYEADTMRQGEISTSLRLVQLAVLSFDNGPLLLEKVLSLRLENVAQRLIGEHLEFVAEGNFIWLVDLQMLEYSTTDMVNRAKIVLSASPWLTDDSPHPEGECPGALDIGLHQPNCVHTGGAALDQQNNLHAGTKVDWQQYALDRNQLRRRIAAYCGLGGVIFDREKEILPAGSVVFDDTRANVSVYVSSISTRMLPPAEKWGPEIDDHLTRISTSQAQVIHLLKKATTRYCEAAAVIQNSKFCCNSFSVIVSRKPTEQLSAVVDMVSISFQSLEALKKSLGALTINSSEPYQCVQRKDLQKCYAIGDRLLATFGYMITRSGDTDCQLHVISLATQFLGLGLVFYTQGHLGPLSTFFLAEPLTEMLLLGMGNDSLYIKASLKDLACLGEMVGGPVFAFELMSTNKVSPDVFQLNPTNAISPQKLKADPTSSILSKSQHLSGQACELLARGVDIGDTWGPALFISEPGAAYGKRLYAIEIGGGVLKAVGSESREAGISSPLPFIQNPGFAHVKRIHGIAIEIGVSKINPSVSQSKKHYLGLMETGAVVSLSKQHYMELIETGGLKTTRAESESKENSMETADFMGDDTEAVDFKSQESSSSRKELDTRDLEDRSTESHLSMPVFHWSPKYGSYEELRSQPTFSCWDWLRIGAITTNMNCPLRPDKSREQSQDRLSNLGTEADFWELSERQVALQAGYYTLLQVGNTYARKLGRTIKQQIIEEWSMFPNIHTLNALWGLQVSLCTGIAKRVSLLHLIQDSLLVHVEPLKHDQWHNMLPKAKAAFQGSINIDHWIKGLDAEEKVCLIATITYILGLLRHTGLNREGTSLSVLWPHPSNISYGIKVPCDKRTFWARMMQDTDSCATFAAVTSLCFEGNNHNCRNMSAPPWLEDTVFLSTAVCRNITATTLAPKTLDPWRLEEGKRYWIGRAGGDCWVLVRRNSKGEPQLFIRINRFPKVLSHSLWKLDVLRERPDTTFVAEEVIVF